MRWDAEADGVQLEEDDSLIQISEIEPTSDALTVSKLVV
jgi:hypothetical protein